LSFGRTRPPINKPPCVEAGAQRPVRAGGAPVLAPAGDDDFFFRFERKIFNPPGVNEAVPLGPTCKATNSAAAHHRKAESIFIIIAAANASPHGPTCKGTNSPSHTRPSAASLPLCLLATSRVFCPAKQFFSIFCRRSSPLFSGTSKVVPTSDRDDSPECRCCRHTNPHFTGTSCVVPTRVVTFSTLRVQTRHYNRATTYRRENPHFTDPSKVVPTSYFQQLARNHKAHSRKWKPASHRHFSTPMSQKPAWHNETCSLAVHHRDRRLSRG